jgi:hypothetical protein
MKSRTLWIILLLLFALSGCSEVKSEYLQMKLNPGIDTIELGTSHTDALAQASYGLRTLEVTVIYQNVDIHQVGTYEIVYQATYGSISKVIRRKVVVVDQTAPHVILRAGIDTIMLGERWIDAGIDVFDSSEIQSITVFGTVEDQVGDYTITYTVKDVHENTTVIIRIVSVLPPVV